MRLAHRRRAKRAANALRLGAAPRECVAPRKHIIRQFRRALRRDSTTRPCDRRLLDHNKYPADNR
jgi:hypothetical protein